MLTLVIFTLLAPPVVRNFRTVRAALAAPEPALLVLGVMGIAAYFGFRAALWYAVTQPCAPRPSLRQSARIWFLSEFARYLPGNVWSFLGRVGGMRLAGVPVAQTTAALVREAATIVATAGLLLPVLRRLEDHQGSVPFDLLTALAGVAGIVGIALLVSPLRYRVAPPSVRARVTAVGWGVLAWVAFGWGNALVLRAFHAEPSTVSLAFASVAAWLLGYVSLLTPSGLGVREGAFQLHLTSTFGTPVAIATGLALVSRLVLTAVEGLLVLGVLGLRENKLSSRSIRSPAASNEGARPST